MKSKYAALVMAWMCVFTCFSGYGLDQKQDTGKALVLNDGEIRRISEAFGHIIGKNLDNPGFKFDLESIIQGVRNGAMGKESPMSEEEYERTIALIQESVFNELASSNLKKAEEFMTENVQNKNIIEVEKEKLQYKILQAGDGDEVQEHGIPLIHYTGKYLDGSVFGSSLERGEPITLPLDQTIVGFSKGLVGSKEGEKRRLFIHPEMGYGTSGHLPPNSLLIFDVEIVKANTSSDLDDSNLSLKVENKEDDLLPGEPLSAEEGEEPEEAEAM